MGYILDIRIISSALSCGHVVTKQPVTWCSPRNIMGPIGTQLLRNEHMANLHHTDVLLLLTYIVNIVTSLGSNPPSKKCNGGSTVNTKHALEPSTSFTSTRELPPYLKMDPPL